MTRFVNSSEPDPRPLLAPALFRLCQQMIDAVPELSHIDARSLLLVSGQARGAARASIRSLVTSTAAARVTCNRQRKLYEINLRPLWFRAATLERRLQALLHEMWHIGQPADGKLAEERRHDPEKRPKQRQQIQTMCRSVLANLDPIFLGCLGHDGEVLMPAWINRPVLTGESVGKSVFSSKDLYLQVVRMITAQSGRTVWW